MIGVRQAVEVREHFTNPRVLLGRMPWILGAMALGPALLILAGEDLPVEFFLFLGGVYVLALALVFGMFRYMRYYVSPDGIRLRLPGYGVATTWDNVERIGTRGMYGEGQVEGLILREPGLSAAPLIRLGSLIDIGSGMALNDYRTFVPLSSLLGKAWRDQLIAGDIRRYAPRLFDEEPA